MASRGPVLKIAVLAELQNSSLGEADATADDLAVDRRDPTRTAAFESDARTRFCSIFLTDGQGGFYKSIPLPGAPTDITVSPDKNWLAGIQVPVAAHISRYRHRHPAAERSESL